MKMILDVFHMTGTTATEGMILCQDLVQNKMGNVSLL